MAQKTDAELDSEKDVIKNETDAGDNTATRVGQMFEDINDSKINNDKIDTADTLDTPDKTVAGRDAVKDYIAAQVNGIIVFGGFINAAVSLPIEVDTLYIAASDFSFDGIDVFDGSWLFGPAGAVTAEDFYIKP